MTRHYSVTSFFRQALHALLARYFLERDLLVDLDFAGMKEGNPQPLFEVTPAAVYGFFGCRSMRCRLRLM
jgi:hypothetical protein